jgi:hypothetical protein
MVSKLSEIRSRLFIPDPDPDILPIPDPGSRGQKGTGSRILVPGSATLNSTRKENLEEVHFVFVQKVYGLDYLIQYQS